MTQLLDYSKEELREIFASLGIEKFRADQVYLAMLSGKDYDDNINVPKSVINQLIDKNFLMQSVKIIRKLESQKEHTTKFLYQLSDGNIIEGVLLSYKFGNTLCVSTQVGCKMNCAFCASGLNGFVRNLSAGEILGQVVAVNKMIGGTVKKREITNIVLMGSGEPLDNFDNVIKFLNNIMSKDGFMMSARNISLSTCGLPHKIEKLADLQIPITLCVSLHAPNDAIRNKIMPISKSYTIAQILDAVKYYNTVTNRRIIFEYILIDKVNNSPTHARELAELLKNIPCHVNLIRLNPVDGRDLSQPSMESCIKFQNALARFNISATLRRSLGDDVEGACGQLRNKVLKEKRDI